MATSTPGSSKVSVEHKTYYLTPSARNYCMLCSIDIRDKYPEDKDLSRKRRLWTDDKKKTKICSDIEKYLEEEIDPSTDFQAVCVSCAKYVTTQLKGQQKKKDDFNKGRKLIGEQFLRTRQSQRHVSKDGEPPSKKKLTYSQNKPLFCKVSIEDKNAANEYTVPLHMKELLEKICTTNVKSILDTLKQIFPDEIQDFAEKEVQNTIQKEVGNICSNASSSFKVNDIEELVTKTFTKQFNELKNDAPVLTSLVSNVATNPRATRNIIKTPEVVSPTIVNTLGSLFFARSRLINAVPTRNMVILRRGGCNRTCFERFQKLNLSLSHSSSLKKQFEATENVETTLQEHSSTLQEHCLSMRENFISAFAEELCDKDIPIEVDDDPANTTMLSLGADESFFEQGALNPNVEITNCSMITDSSENETEDITELDDSSILPVIDGLDHLDFDDVPSDSLLDESWSSFQPDRSFCANNASFLKSITSVQKPTFHPKFMFVGDNVDVNIKPRYYSRTSSTQDLHMYNLIAVTNRIPIPQHLIEMKAPCYEKATDIPLTFFIPNNDDEHLLKEEMKILLARDLVKYVDNLSWMKKFVTNHIPHDHVKETSLKSEVLPLGVINEKETTTDGMINIMEKQHELVPGHNSSSLVRMFSVGDLLTVERQQNAQQDMRDASTPSAQLLGLIPALADFHSYGNFLEVVWHILYSADSSADIGTLYQARNFLGAKAVPGSPMKELNACEDLLFLYSDALAIAAFKEYEKDNPINPSGNDDSDKELMDHVLNDMVDRFMISSKESIAEASQKKYYECPACDKSFKRMKTLRDHLKEHENRTPTTKSDCLQNYSVNALALTYIAKDFVDARKHGDGERITRLYKFLMLYYKIDSRHKYAFQSLHLLAQISYLLPPALAYELKWNRFVNTKGRIDSNVELDRHLEHQNKYVKAEFARCQGKLTEKSIARSSRSYSTVQSILTLIDDELHINKPSGRHTNKDRSNDVTDLAEQYISAEIFRYKEGRSHSKFPGFPESYIDKLHIIEFKQWIFSKLRDFNRMNIYKRDGITVQ